MSDSVRCPHSFTHIASPKMPSFILYVMLHYICMKLVVIGRLISMYAVAVDECPTVRYI